MRIVGLTGGICAGKSGVTRYLLRKGYRVIDCDKITDNLYTYQWFTDGLRHLFGKKIIYNGEVNRGKLGSLVFKDYKEMRKLNNYCLPYVFKEVLNQISQLEQEGHPFIFIDAPILFESGLNNVVNFTDFWVLDVDKVEQIKRLRLRKPYLSPRAIQSILNSQLSNAERLQYATYIIENNNKRDRKQLYERIEKGLRLLNMGL